MDIRSAYKFTVISALLCANLLVSCAQKGENSQNNKQNSPAAFNADGGGSYGGGDDLVARFKSIAGQLITHHELYGLTDSEAGILNEALKSAKIETASILINPASKKPLTCDDGPEFCPDKLVIFGSPGLIQLKTDSRRQDEDSWERVLADQRPFAHYVAHELFRASGRVGQDGRPLDDGYAISITRCRLNEMDATYALLNSSDNEVATPKPRFNPNSSLSHEEQTLEIKQRFMNGKAPAANPEHKGAEKRKCYVYDEDSKLVAKQTNIVDSTFSFDDRGQLTKVTQYCETSGHFVPSADGHFVKDQCLGLQPTDPLSDLIEVSEDVAGDLIVRAFILSPIKPEDLEKAVKTLFYCPATP